MNTEIAQEIIRRSKVDQAMRMKYIKDGVSWDESVDRDNTNYMKKIIKKIGWPKISDIGLKASNATWLLVQHADHDQDFQKKCLKLIKSLPDGEINKSNIAYLEDRILVAEGKPQVYGTQFYKKGSLLIPRPIKDIKNIDSRRKLVGLGTFKKYEKLMNEKYSN